MGDIKYRKYIDEKTRNEIEKKFLSFTLSQREAAIFLLFSVLGKGYLIGTFA